jgi:hypothetical protein
MLIERRQRAGIRRLPVDADEQERPAGLGAGKTEVVLDQLVGIEEPEAGDVGERRKPA